MFYLHEEVDEERHSRVECECADGGHVGERAQEEAGRLRERRQQHRRRNLAHDATHVLRVRLRRATLQQRD